MSRLSQDPSNLAPFIVTPRASTQARRVQNANTGGDRPNTVEREIGNETLVGRTYDTPNVTLSVEANLVNARLLSLFANRDPDATFSNVKVSDLLGNADVDLMMVQRNTARTAWLQTVYVKQASIGSYRIQAATNSSAVETFTLAATNKTAFERVVTVDHVLAAAPGQTAYTLSLAPVPLTRGQAAGNKLASAALAQVNGSSVYLLETTDFTVSGTTVTLVNADIIAQVITGTQFAFAYQSSASTAGDPYTAKDTISPAAIHGYYFIPVSITVSGSNLSVTGMQSIEATMNFNQQKEVGMGSQAVGAFRQIPAEVTGQFVVFSEDNNVEKLMTAGTTTSADTDYPLEAYRSDVVITITFKHPTTLATLRIDYLSGVSITGDSKDVRVGQAVGKQFNFGSADNFEWYVSKVV